MSVGYPQGYRVLRTHIPRFHTVKYLFFLHITNQDVSNNDANNNDHYIKDDIYNVNDTNDYIIGDSNYDNSINNNNNIMIAIIKMAVMITMMKRNLRIIPMALIIKW